MKKLPLSRQDFKELINENCIYVDKTELIYRLINQGFEYFLSRPRRFGKSLLVSTLREIFLGNQGIFKGLWIYDKIEWQKHPVIHISFNEIGYTELGLAKAISKKLTTIGQDAHIELTESSISQLFLELILKMSIDKKVVILIDEYDKPIIDYLDDLPKAEENRAILKNFYSIIKENERFIRFLFITGVSKFSKVSIFSDLNQLTDITLSVPYANLTGITPSELKTYFDEYIQELATYYKDFHQDIYQAIEDEYLGYSWDGFNFVYNPFGIINVLENRKMVDYWYQSGTPTFLVKLIKSSNLSAFDIQHREISPGVLEKYEISNITTIPLLFQTGYLTIKHWDLRTNILTLDYPNKEVERSFSIHLLSEFNGGKSDKTQGMIMDIKKSLIENDIDNFIYRLNILFEGIAYPIAQKKEAYFHSIFYLVLKMLGFIVECEIITIRGRIDCIIKTTDHIYIIEFKTTTAKIAMQQIREKNYHLKFMDDIRSIVLLGIAFDIENKCIKEYLVEAIK